MSGHGVPSNYRGATRRPDRAVLAALHASDEQAHLAKRHPRWWQALVDHGPLSLVRVTKRDRRSTIDAMVLDGLLWPCPNIAGAWLLTGWGLMVREAGIYTREHPDDL